MEGFPNDLFNSFLPWRASAAGACTLDYATVLRLACYTGGLVFCLLACSTQLPTLLLKMLVPTLRARSWNHPLNLQIWLWFKWFPWLALDELVG